MQMKLEHKTPEISLNDDEKAVFTILQNVKTVVLQELKIQSGLSNKKWNKTIKVLTKNNLEKVSKTDTGLIVEMV